MGTAAFTLDRQPIQMLDHWHDKATMLLHENVRTWEYWEVVNQVQGEIFEAALLYKPRRGSDAARQFEIVLRQAQHDERVTVFSVEEFEQIVDGLVMATGPIPPNKKIGATSRGRRLTTAGLLIRYQNFLVQELETLSWKLYGDSHYAQQFRIDDEAVNKRCKRFGDALFDEETLSDRARSVLKSLKIDAENVVERPTRGGGAR
ncbi:MAG: hypothetical protein JWQ94_545 [Tardiphaga sp.]|nr:hypothetical protein [Tardiphaga sp.]